MPAAAIPLITAGIGAGSSILGGVLGSRAANKAAQTQSTAAQQEAQTLRDVLGQYNPQIGQAVTAGQAGVGGAMDQYRQQALAANELLSPYTGAGTEALSTLREFMAPGGAGNRTFTAADMEAYDPGYQFRIDEAQKALQTSAAARGGALGGGTLKALNQRVQDVASSEFGSAAERFRQQQQDRYNRLFGVSELGGRYAGQAGQNLMTAGAAGQRAAEFAGDLGFRGAGMMGQNALSTQQQISDLMTGGAAARAAGTVGSANAWGQGLAGVAGAAGQAGSQYLGYRQGQDVLNSLRNWINPALKTFTPPTGPALGLPQTQPIGTPPTIPWEFPEYAPPDFMAGIPYQYPR